MVQTERTTRPGMENPHLFDVNQEVDVGWDSARRIFDRDCVVSWGSLGD